MSFFEVIYRFKKYFQSLFEYIGFVYFSTKIQSDIYGTGWVLNLPRKFNKINYVKAADKILKGNFNIFSIQNKALGFPPDWNKDPYSGKSAPIHFGKFMNYRDENKYGNIKFLWEINRHLELVTLAQAYHLSGDETYLKAIEQYVSSWIKDSPFMQGLNWSSPIEVAIRLTNWAVAWHLMGGNNSSLFKDSKGSQFKEKWLTSIYQHCHFLSKNLSFYSSANNHLLAEYLGLFLGSLVWPCWKESKKWQEIAFKGFESEISKQVYLDGVAKEQAIYYQHEVIDMMLLSLLFAEKNHLSFNEAFLSRLEKMMDFIFSISDINGHIPMIGDSDDALIVRFAQGDSPSVYQSILATGAVMFKRGDFAKKAKNFDDKTRWLLGDNAEKKFNDLLKQPSRMNLKNRSMSFPEGGYYLFGKNFGAHDEVLGIVDCGPLGFLSIAAHGHADALAFILSVAGHEILIDPGTYAYHTKSHWRKYFKGTSAHNTVRIDKENQSEDAGNFLWLFKAKAKCTQFVSKPLKQNFEGYHDGYSRLKDPFKHVRKISYDGIINEFIISDVFECKDTHQIEIFWHVSEFCDVALENDLVMIHCKDVKVEMTILNKNLKPEIYFGDEEKPLGWISRKFNQKHPTYSLRWASSIKGNDEFITRFKVIL